MFGEKVAGFTEPVVNEREVRAAAGILFFVATVAFLGAWHVDQLLPAQLMIVGFFLDFSLRVWVPRYAPSLILGRLAVANQRPEYTAAAPKRFAWGLGLGLASLMLVTMIFMREMSLVNFAICGLCILLLFMESAFGICLGCLVYNKWLNRNVGHCAGGVCEVKPKEPIQQVSAAQLAVLVGFTLALLGVLPWLEARNQAHDDGTPHHRILHEFKTERAPAPAHGASSPAQHAH